MFPLVAQTKCQEILPNILDHLTSLQGRIDHYFPTLSIEDYDWVRDPFLEILSREGIFTLREEELTDIRHDRTLKLKYRDSSLDSFWVSIENEYPSIAIKCNMMEYFFGSVTALKLDINRRMKLRMCREEHDFLIALSALEPAGLLAMNDMKCCLPTAVKLVHS